jgi:hypothetical protein
MKLVYTVWFRDLAVPMDDPDHEWPACFVIEGENASGIEEWGNHLAQKYADSHGQQLLASRVETPDAVGSRIDDLPTVFAGVDVGDDAIGW